MIKYYKELEKSDAFTFPLVQVDHSVTSRKVSRGDLPLHFFDKYGHLLRIIKEIDFLIRSIDLDKLYKMIGSKRYAEGLGSFNFDAYLKILKLYPLWKKLKVICQK